MFSNLYINFPQNIFYIARICIEFGIELYLLFITYIWHITSKICFFLSYIKMLRCIKLLAQFFVSHIQTTNITPLCRSREYMKKEIYSIFIKPVKTRLWNIRRYAKVNRFILYWSQFRMTNSKCGGNGKRAKKCISPERSCLVSGIIFSVICLQSNDCDISEYIRQFYTFMFSTIPDLRSSGALRRIGKRVQGGSTAERIKI